MTGPQIRELSADEMALVCGGYVLDSASVNGTRLDLWPQWHNFLDTGRYDPNFTDTGSGGGGGGGGGVETVAQMRDDLAANPEFGKLSDRLESLILHNDKLTTAVHNMLQQGVVFQRTDTASRFDGKNMFVNDAGLKSGETTDAVADMFLHEVGHFVNGVPYSQNYANPEDYAKARAESEVKADMFMVEIAHELGISYDHTGTILLSTANELVNGTFNQHEFDASVNANLMSGISLGAGPYVTIPGDLNSDGRVSNDDLYLSQWRGPSGQNYSEWQQSQSGGGSGDDGGGTGHSGPPGSYTP